MTLNMKIKTSVVFCIIVGSLQPPVVTTSPTYFDMNNLYTDVFCCFNTNLIPIENQTDTLHVGVSLKLIEIQDFNEQTGHISLSAVLQVTWIDQQTAWNVSTYNGIESFVLPQNEVWHPAITLVNPSDDVGKVGHASFTVRYSSTGHADWHPAVLIRTVCQLNPQYFPFDRQECSFDFTSWGYLNTEVLLVVSDSVMDIVSYEDNDQWILKKTAASSFVAQSKSYARFSIEIQRRHNFYVLNVVLPVIMLGVLNALVFMVPAESGERISYAIVFFLTYAVYMTIINEYMPRATETMSTLSYYLSMCIIYSAVVAALGIMTVRVHHTDYRSRVPKWLAFVVQLSRCQPCRKPPTENQKSEDIENNRSIGILNPAEQSPPTEDISNMDGISHSDESVFTNHESDMTSEAETKSSGIADNDDTFRLKRRLAPDERSHKTLKDNHLERRADVDWKMTGRTLDLLLFCGFLIWHISLSICFIGPLAAPLLY